MENNLSTPLHFAVGLFYMGNVWCFNLMHNAYMPLGSIIALIGLIFAKGLCDEADRESGVLINDHRLCSGCKKRLVKNNPWSSQCRSCAISPFKLTIQDKPVPPGWGTRRDKQLVPVDRSFAERFDHSDFEEDGADANDTPEFNLNTLIHLYIKFVQHRVKHCNNSIHSDIFNDCLDQYVDYINSNSRFERLVSRGIESIEHLGSLRKEMDFNFRLTDDDLNYINVGFDITAEGNIKHLTIVYELFETMQSDSELGILNHSKLGAIFSKCRLDEGLRRTVNSDTRSVLRDHCIYYPKDVIISIESGFSTDTNGNVLQSMYITQIFPHYYSFLTSTNTEQKIILKFLKGRTVKCQVGNRQLRNVQWRSIWT